MNKTLRWICSLSILISLFNAGQDTLAQVIAHDLRTGEASNSLNLNSYEVTASSTPTTWSPGDWFGVGTIIGFPHPNGMPFAIADDSQVDVSGGLAGSAFTTDTQGIIDGTINSDDRFFSLVDVANSNNPSGSASATWEFDITGGQLLEISIEMAAMGDFEADGSDFITWSYSVDGSAFTPIFTSTIDEAGSQVYTMQGGATPTLNDPMLINGTVLNDEFQAFTASISGTGTTLTIRLEAGMDGSSEAFAARNILISERIIAHDLRTNFAATSLNLNSYEVTASSTPTTWGSGDWFGVASYGTWPQASGMPFAIADDSQVGVSGGTAFTPDTQGIIDGTINSDDRFLSFVDIVNGSNPSGSASATWEFDITGSSNLEVSIEMAAMGDFEASQESLVWAYSIDGSSFVPIFTASIDESGSQIYTMQGGATPTLNDPMLINSTVLNDDFQALTAGISGTGTTLTLRLEASADGGNEAFVARNIFIIRDANPQLQQVITVNESLNSFLTTMTGTPSAEQTYTVEGTSLTSALTITASADFEVSLTSGTGFGSSVVIPSSSANAGAVTIYVRYNPAAGTSHNGTLTHASTGATDVVINIDGSLPASITPIATARGLSAGTQVTITGQLTVAGEFDRNIYVQDATGGIALFDASRDIANGGFSIGDSVLLTGEVGAFRTEIQLSALTDIFNLGVATVPFQPETITFTALSTSASDYLGELVRVANPSFPNPGDIIYGEGVIELSDGATGNIFIDGDVTSLVAKAQPASCSEVIGVLAIFDGVPQIKPRLEADLACLDDYVSQASTQTACISASNTLEIVTWNIEWFGHPSNSPAGSDPNAEAIQIDSVRNAILQMDADLYAFQEISDLNAFATLVAQLPGYAYVASPAVSGGPPVTQDEDQQLVFLYRTSVINPISSKALFETVHPLYNGGDDSQLTGYPVTDRSRFFASGRLPFMMTADVTINGVTDQYRFVNLHGRANNSGSPQERYDMRRYDVTALEDTLSTQYGTDKLIMLGDYNDDVDETVADIVSTTTSYDAYTTSPAEYDIVTDELSAAGFRSTVGFENMIDHIMVTNEIQSNYIPNSAQVYLEFFSSTYSSTTSDHFPVGIRMEVQAVPACDFTATASGTTEINLSWTDVSNIETEYVLEFSTDNTNWFTVPMSPLAADANSYTHTGLMSGTLYYYRLKAVATTGTNESEYVLTQAATGGAMIPEISLVVSPTQVTEDADLLTMRFTFTSTVAPASDLTIRFSVGGNAVYNDDYYLINPMGVTFSANSGTIVLPAGQTSVDLILQAQQDAIQEGDETIVITIQP